MCDGRSDRSKKCDGLPQLLVGQRQLNDRLMRIDMARIDTGNLAS